ncbi:MAG: hypothetical protein AAB571_07930 [Chloroflexota bacterium]
MPPSSLPARLVGAIRLARYLRRLPAWSETLVEELEDSDVFRQCAAHIRAVRFPEAEMDAGLPVGVIGQFRWREGRIRIAYRHPAWGQEYLWEGESDQSEAKRLLLQLRLVSTRSRLTHLMLMGLAQHQRMFLDSGDPLDLELFTQAALGRWIDAEDRQGRRLVWHLPATVDPSLISRAARGVNMLTPQGQAVSIRYLMPSVRVVLQRRLKALLDEEAANLRRGLIEQPADDEALRVRLVERWGIKIARRTVSLARQTLGLPASYRRDGRHTYPPRGTAFSQVYSLTAATLRDQVLTGPGVYEIALAVGEVSYPEGASPVIYLGHSRNLRKRLADHLRPDTKNIILRAYLTGSRCVVRYLSASTDDLRVVERALAQSFEEIYGALPKGNRLHP